MRDAVSRLVEVEHGGSMVVGWSTELGTELGAGVDDAGH